MENTGTVWTLIETVLAQLHTLRLPHALLWGPPATGKTHAATHVAVGERVYSITLTQETAAYELRGYERPVSGSFVWVDGPVVAAMRAGARLVVNEIQRASADTMSFLLSVLDDRELKSVTLPTGEVVVAAPGFSVVATSNDNPDTLDEALASRFPVQIEVADLHPEAVNSLPADLRNAAQGMSRPNDGRRITIRAWQAFAQLRSTMAVEDAAKAVFGTQAADVVASLAIAAE